jgi:hypothetical protein
MTRGAARLLNFECPVREVRGPWTARVSRQAAGLRLVRLRHGDSRPDHWQCLMHTIVVTGTGQL